MVQKAGIGGRGRGESIFGGDKLAGFDGEKKAVASRWMQHVIVLNLMVVALAPLVLLVLIAGTGRIRDVPIWGRGIVLSWAFFLPLWSPFWHFHQEKPPRLRQAGFLATSLVIPAIMAMSQGASIREVLFDFSSFHMLGIGLAFGFVMLLGPFFEVEIRHLTLIRISPRGLCETLRVTRPLPLLMIISGLLALVVVLPPIAAEYMFFSQGGRSIFFWISRYASLGPEVLVFSGMLMRLSIYGKN